MAKAPFKSSNDKAAYWHSTAHILADAVKRLFPKVKLAIGPPIDEGFYYDFDKKDPFTSEDLQKIEKEMQKIIKENKKFESVKMSRAEAKKFLKDEPYKLELLEEIPDKSVSFHRHGKFTDLCRMPVIQSTGQVGAFKLLNVAAAYWRGDPTKASLQRIYGVSFPSKPELDKYLKIREEAEKRDHRKLGPQLDLFSLHEIAPGFPFMHPKGTIVWNILRDLMRDVNNKYGFQEIITPILARTELFKTSGHWQHYRELMFTIRKKDEDLSVRPMGCPFAAIVFKSKARSYRELPLRLAEFNTLVRDEPSGAWHGLTRSRELHQDDAHDFVSEEQLLDELTMLLKIVSEVYSVFKLEYRAVLSTRPKKFMGDKHLWDKAEVALKSALQKNKWKWSLEKGEGAFYGPKIDFFAKDAIGREWQLATLQLDFQQPLSFGLRYTGADNKPHTPIMIHRAVLGSINRFLGVLIEHYAGAFPAWLAPVQVKLVNFTDRNTPYTKKVEDQLRKAGLRVETNYEPQTVEKKVRSAELEKVNAILVCGDKEEKNNTVAVRWRGTNKVKFGVKVEDFIKEMKKLIEKRM